MHPGTPEARYRCGGFGFSVPGGTAMTPEPHFLKNWSSGIAEVSFGSRGPWPRAPPTPIPPAPVPVHLVHHAAGQRERMEPGIGDPNRVLGLLERLEQVPRLGGRPLPELDEPVDAHLHVDRLVVERPGDLGRLVRNLSAGA